MAEPTLDPYAADNAPRARPLSYPGARPPSSALISEVGLWEITDRNGQRLRWASHHPQRLATCRVALYPDESAALHLSSTTRPHLASVLEEQFAVSPDARVPVLAIGSNAAPAQLRHKFRTNAAPLLIPSIRCRIRDLRVGFSSFVSPLGYVPATLVPEAGAETEVALQLLDEGQLAAVDETERSAYRRVWLDSPVLLETGEILSGAYAYVSRDGYLGDAGGPWVMGAPGEQQPTGLDPTRWFPTQTALLERLVAHPELAAAFGRSPEEIVARGVDAAASTARLVEAGLVVDDTSLYDRDDHIGQSPRRYGSLITPAVIDIGRRTVTAVAGRSDDWIERSGRSVVRLGAELDQLLGRPHNVELVSAALVAGQGDRAPRVVATVLRETAAAAPSPAPTAIEVDHVLRMALGLEAGEHIVVRPVEVERPRWGDRILGSPNSLSLRVTLADPATTERDVCLVSRLSLDLLGVNNGDYVVLEGAADKNGVVRTLAVKAFEVPDDILAERERVSSGTWGARFPGVRETLGVWPDIPTIFLDSSIRARLGISAQQLGTVRARPARRQQVGAELREMMLILAVALIGLLSIVENTVLVVVLFASLVVAAAALVIVKLRRRLSHPRQHG